MEVTKVENKIKKTEELREKGFGNEEKEAENENDFLREIVSRDYLSEEIKDLYALDYVSGSQSVWDVLENKQKADRKRGTVKYKKYADKFKEDVFGEGGLMSFLKSQNLDLNNQEEIEKELLEYLHTNNLKKVLNLMVEKILEREKGSIGEEEMENIKGAFSYYKYHPGDKRAKERFLEKFLNRGKMSIRKEQEESRKEVALGTEKDEGKIRVEGYSENGGDSEERSQKDLSEEPKNTEIKSENGKEAFSKEDFEKKYILGKIYSNSAGKEIKIKEYDSEEKKVRVEILPELFNDLGEDEDENGNKTKEWEFNKSVSEAKEEKIMERKEFEEWFQKEGFSLEVEEDEEQEDIQETGGRGSEKQEKEQNALTEEQEKIKGFYVDQKGKAVVVNPVNGGEVEIVLKRGKEKFSPDKAESILNRFEADLQKFETKEDCIEYLKSKILTPDKDVGIDKEEFRVVNYFYDENNKCFKANIETNGEEKAVFLDWLKNEIENIESDRIQGLIEKYGNFEQYDYKNKETGEVFVVDGYFLDRKVGWMFVLLKDKKSRLEKSFSLTQFRKKFKRLSQEQSGSESEKDEKEVIDKVAGSGLEEASETESETQESEEVKEDKAKEEDMEAMLDKVSAKEEVSESSRSEEKSRKERINLDLEEYNFIVNDLWNFVREYRDELEDYIKKIKQDLTKEEKEEVRQKYLGNLWSKELPEVIDEAGEILKLTKKEDIVEYLKEKAEKLNKNS